MGPSERCDMFFCIGDHMIFASFLKRYVYVLQMLIRLTALPLGMDKNEWLATHSEFFNAFNKLTGKVIIVIFS